MMSRIKPYFETHACFFPFVFLFFLCSLYFSFSPVKKNLQRLQMHSRFLWGGGHAEKGALFNLNQFAYCVWQHGLSIVLAQDGYGAPGCRDWSERQKEKKREQELLSLTLLSKSVCCGIVVWVWVSGWTGLNPSDLTLIKFKIYNQQSGDYSSFFPWGILGPSLKQINYT